jgi:hypothetical protein
MAGQSPSEDEDGDGDEKWGLVSLISSIPHPQTDIESDRLKNDAEKGAFCVVFRRTPLNSEISGTFPSTVSRSFPEGS